MYSIVKNVLNQGGYNLTAIIGKIDSLWLQGKLTDKEYNELVKLAREGANYQDSINVLERLDSLEKRLEALENTDKPKEDYPEYVMGKQYTYGDKCSFWGVNYVCCAPKGAVCVWSPKDYPSYWEALA